jgi:phosphoribosylformylglycinamidine cyclo-ligase
MRAAIASRHPPEKLESERAELATPRHNLTIATESVYATAGVDQSRANDAVDALVDVLRQTRLQRPSQQVIRRGHFATVLRITPAVGIALSTDGVGTKLLVARALGRYDTIGIDCIAMNVNDVICVGARPIALLDYIATDEAAPERLAEVADGLRVGCELAGIEIPGGELAEIGEIVRGLDLVGTCVGVVGLDEIVDGRRIRPGDTVIGLPSSGLHANGFTLARRALAGLALSDQRLGRPLGDLLLTPTEIYVKPILELLESPVEVHGLAHITSNGLNNLLRLNDGVGYELDNLFSVPPLFTLIQQSAGVTEDEMYEVFNMGCGFCCVVAPQHEPDALAILQRHSPAARSIGRTTDEPGVIRRIN